MKIIITEEQNESLLDTLLNELFQGLEVRFENEDRVVYLNDQPMILLGPTKAVIDNQVLEEVKKVLLVVVTSDRGLCGAFNSSVIKLTTRLMKETYSGKEVTLLTVGKKGSEFFGRLGYQVDNRFRDAFLNLNGEIGFELGEYLLEAYKKGTYDKIEVVYNRFKNAATVLLTNESYLPIVSDDFGQSKGKKNDYIFEPSNAEILESLIPRILKTQVYRALLDSFASEHGSRMVAMDKATDNAGELLKSLKLEYNRARQAAITTELTEIVSGAAALQG